MNILDKRERENLSPGPSCSEAGAPRSVLDDANTQIWAAASGLQKCQRLCAEEWTETDALGGNKHSPKVKKSKWHENVASTGSTPCRRRANTHGTAYSRAAQLDILHAMSHPSAPLILIASFRAPPARDTQALLQPPPIRSISTPLDRCLSRIVAHQ